MERRLATVVLLLFFVVVVVVVVAVEVFVVVVCTEAHDFDEPFLTHMSSFLLCRNIN